MGAIIGFVLGYAFGTRAGQNGWTQLIESWQRISSSEEFKELLTDGMSVAPEFLRHGAEVIVERLGQNGGLGP